jgi:excisionase family DNA binding protein
MDAPSNGERITNDNQVVFLEKSPLFGTKCFILAIRQCILWRLICGTLSGFRVSRKPSGFYRKHDERRTKAMDERWLTDDDICKYLNVSNETIYKWIEQRAMPGHRVGRRWMFKRNYSGPHIMLKNLII